jgi:protocatechuate 3,4-dioxygenase beta subunit
MTGWWRATIWLPGHVVEMPTAHQRLIIEHELAHFRRKDFPWQAYASLMAAFWWWNPLVFILLRKLKSEAELAADEAVVSRGSAGADYAEALVRVAAGASYIPCRQIGVPMLGNSSIEKRVKEIVSENPFRNRIGWIASMMIGLVAVGGGLLASFTAVAQQREEGVADAGLEKSDDSDAKQLADKGANTLVCIVTAEDGTLLEGADVYFELLRMPHGEVALPIELVGKTDDSGELTIQVDPKFGSPENLKYSIFVRHPDHGTAARGGITLSWQDPKKFRLSKGFPLKFRVLDEKDRPVANLKLRIASASLPAAYPSTDYWGDVPELPEGFWNATSDAEGRCMIDGLPGGRYYVNHDGPNYAHFAGEHHGRFQHVAGADVKEIVLKAMPGASISGTVRYTDGSPVAGAEVRIFEHNHYTQGGCSAETITDSNGRYVLERLLPSDYDVKVIVGEDIRDSWTADLKSIELALAEKKTGFDIGLEKGGVLTGRVTLGDTGIPVPRYQVGINNKTGDSPLCYWWTVTDQEGYYSSRIPAGTMQVYPAGPNPKGYTTQTYDRSQMGVDVEVKEGGTYNNDFSLLSETGFRGIVVDTAGDPVKGALVTCYDPPDHMSDPMKTNSDDEGRFSFIFPAGTETAGIFAEFEGMISKPGKKFPVANEAKVVVGETQWARVSGRVLDTDDRPIDSAQVMWMDSNNIAKDPYTVMTDSNGRFESNILPENTLITFWASKESFGTDAAQASFKDGERVELEPIRLKPANASIRGTVVDVEGKPVAGAQVAALGDQQNEFINVRTNENGDFVLNGLVDGWMDLQIQKSTIVMQSRLRIQSDLGIIVFRNNYHRVVRREPVNFVGKPAPLLVGETWFNTDPLQSESKGKVRLISFVGFDRSLLYHSRTVKALERIRKEIPDKDLEVILVHTNWPKQEIEEILKSDFPDFKLPLVIEPEEGSMSEKFGLGNWLSVVIDQTGKVAFQGTWKWDEAQKQVRLLLGKPEK